jgi:hypothetical protein
MNIEILVGEFVVFFVAVYGLYALNKYVLSDKQLKASAKLSAQMSNFKRNYPEFADKRSEIVASGLGDLGITGILDELGIDPKLLANPMVKGLIDRYAPKLIEQLSKGGKGGEVSKGQEIDLL